MRIAIASSSPISLPLVTKAKSLCAEVGSELIAVISAPDKEAGRGKVLTPNQISQAALDLNLPLVKPVNEAELNAFLNNQKIDLVITMAFGQLIKASSLAIPTYGWINVHFSLLPKYRGAAPVQYALLNQDEFTGISIFKLAAGMDNGPIIWQEEVAIAPAERADQLLARLVKYSIAQLPEIIKSAGKWNLKEQDGEPTYAPKIAKEAGEVNWKLTSEEIFARFRAFYPWPGLFTFQAGERIKLTDLKILEENFASSPPGKVFLVEGKGLVATGNGALEIVTLQPAGKRELSFQDYWNGIKQEVRDDLLFATGKEWER
jgi:methionyl-tRNA formyltransferase